MRAQRGLGAGHERGVERAGHRQRDDPDAGRRVAASCSSAAIGAGRDDLATAVDVGADQVQLFQGGQHGVGVAAHQGGHPGGGERAGRAHRGAADGGQVDRVQRGQHAGERGGGEFADRVPGDDRPGRDGQGLRGQQCGGHHQRLGDRGVLDLVGAGGGAEPDRSR